MGIDDSKRVDDEQDLILQRSSRNYKLTTPEVFSLKLNGLVSNEDKGRLMESYIRTYNLIKNP